jgi:hypothetical protein
MALPVEEWTFLPDGILVWQTPTQFLGRLPPSHRAISGLIRHRVSCESPNGHRREFEVAAPCWATIIDLTDAWSVSGYRYSLAG